MLARVVEALYAEEPKSLLYHYTSLSGLLGIVNSRRHWASELRYMNDGEELRHFVEHLDGQIRQRLETGTGPADVLTQFQAWAQERVANGPLLFAISFTEEGNLLMARLLPAWQRRQHRHLGRPRPGHRQSGQLHGGQVHL